MTKLSIQGGEVTYQGYALYLIIDRTESWPWNSWHFTALSFYSVPFGNETFIYWSPIKSFKICICYKNMLINIRHDPHPWRT